MVIIIVGLIYYILNKFFNISIPCPIYKITGLYCPGCGVTRMCVSLINLDFCSAFHNNQLIFLSIPIFIIFGVVQTVKYIKTGKNSLNRFQEYFLYIYIIVLILFGVLRNIPYFYFLRPLS